MESTFCIADNIVGFDIAMNNFYFFKTNFNSKKCLQQIYLVTESQGIFFQKLCKCLTFDILLQRIIFCIASILKGLIFQNFRYVRNIIFSDNLNLTLHAFVH